MVKKKIVFFIATVATMAFFVGCKIVPGSTEEAVLDNKFSKSDFYDSHYDPQESTGVKGHCSLEASLLGYHQKVLSYCLYGNFALFGSGFSTILTAAKSLYPDWSVRLYTDPRLFEEQLAELKKKHANLLVCDVANLPGTRRDIRNVDPMFWRMAVMADEQVDVFLIRDIDAQMLPREAAAVEEFLVSGLTLHVMRDRPSHNVPILGGMYGVRHTKENRKTLFNIREILFNKGTMNNGKPLRKGTDQKVLKTHLYEKVAPSILAHDSYLCTKFVPRGKPFPTRRDGKLFVGNKIYNGLRRIAHVTKICPVACRPKNHTDWQYC